MAKNQTPDEGQQQPKYTQEQINEVARDEEVVRTQAMMQFQDQRIIGLRLQVAELTKANEELTKSVEELSAQLAKGPKKPRS